MSNFERTSRYTEDPIHVSRDLVDDDLDADLREAGATLTVHKGNRRVEIGVKRIPEPIGSEGDETRRNRRE